MALSVPRPNSNARRVADDGAVISVSFDQIADERVG